MKPKQPHLPGTGQRSDVPNPVSAHGEQNSKTEKLPVETTATLGLVSATVPKKWHWHYHTLRSLQQRLLDRRNELQRTVGEPLEPHSLDEADTATDEFDHDLALTQLSASQDALLEITEALQRISDGRYGVCEETGETIPAERLKAVPWTRFTRQVEERLEREGVVNWVRVNKSSTVRNHGQILFKPGENIGSDDTGDETPEP